MGVGLPREPFVDGLAQLHVMLNVLPWQLILRADLPLGLATLWVTNPRLSPGTQPGTPSTQIRIRPSHG